ncbi:MAG: hypothetical protein ACLPG5_13140, partial [Acidocella sp.]
MPSSVTILSCTATRRPDFGAQRAFSSSALISQKPADPTQPVVVYVTSKDSGKDKWREVLRIDPETHLISSIERYAEREGKEAQISKMEFSDYNVPIDDKMFSLRGDLPADVHIADKLNQTIGVPQGSMTDEQIATDAVRQFF